MKGEVHTKECDAGVLVYGQTTGPALSSARQEAIALYAGLAIPGAQRYGVDNTSAVLDLQQDLRRKGQRGKPWGLQDDGDVWEMIAKAIAARGKSATAVTKVKGHAKQEHIDNGETTAAHKEGNDLADEAAGLAKTAQRLHHSRIMRLLSMRWERAQMLVREVQTRRTCWRARGRGVNDCWPSLTSLPHTGKQLLR